MSKRLGPKLGTGRSGAALGGLKTQSTSSDSTQKGQSSESRPGSRIAPSTAAQNFPVKKPGIIRKSRDEHKISLQKVEDIAENPIVRHGLSERRPEIISIFDFLPIYDDAGENLLPAGEKLEIMIESGRLRADNIAKLIDELLVNEETGQLVKELEDKFTKEIQSAEEILDLLDEVLGSLEKGKLSLDIKDSEDPIRNFLDAARKNKLLRLRSPRDIFLDELGFSQEGYDSFSNSKIILQLISDLLFILSKHSPALLDDITPGRNEDSDPFSINKNLDEGSVSQADLKKFSSRDKDFSVLGENDLNRFLDLLPDESRSKIKVLLTLLSKELRVSSGLGDRNTLSTLQSRFGFSVNSDPFLEMFGNPGKNILDPSEIPDSYSSIARIEVGDRVVLPFESRIISRNDNEQYIPGSKYLIDSIIKSENRFNTENLRAFSDSFRSLSTDVNAVSRDLIGISETSIDDSIQTLYSTALFDRVKEIIGKFISDRLSSKVNKDDVSIITVAILDAASKDRVLKNLIFQYVLILSLRTPQRDLSSDRLIYSLARNEIRRVGDIEKIAEDIDSDASNREIVLGDKSLGEPFRIIIEKIVDRLESLRSVTAKVVDPSSRTVSSDEDSLLLDPKPGNVIKALSNMGPSNVFKQMIDFINEVDKDALDRSQRGYLNREGLTRYHGLRPSTIVAMSVEIFASMFDSFSSVKFERSRDVRASIKKTGKTAFSSESFLIRYSPLDNKKFSMSMDSSSTAIGKSGISALRKKLLDEDRLVPEIINYLVAVERSFRNIGADPLVEFFSQNKLNKLLELEDADDIFGALSREQTTLSRNALEDIKESFTRKTEIRKLRVVPRAAINTLSGNKSVRSDGRSTGRLRVNTPVGINRSKDRFRNSSRKTSPLKFSRAVPPFNDDTVISKNLQSMIFSCLREDKLRIGPADNLRVLSVGLPSGFMDALRERFIIGGDDNLELPRESDIVRLDVFRKDIEFDDIVFKPRSFLFEISRFVPVGGPPDMLPGRKPIAKAIRGVRFRRIRKKLHPGPIDVKLDNLDEILTDESYNFLTTQEKEEIIRNHSLSHALSHYIRLLSDVNLSEDSFLINEQVASEQIDNETKDRFRSIILAHIRGVANRQVTFEEMRKNDDALAEILNRLDKNEITKGVLENVQTTFDRVTNSQNLQISEDLVSFSKMNNPSSFVTGATARRRKIVSPKMFERVLNIPIDPDDFEIDEKLTLSTESGRLAFEKRLMQRRLEISEEVIDGELSRVVRLRARKSSESKISMSEIFVAVSLVEDDRL